MISLLSSCTLVLTGDAKIFLVDVLSHLTGRIGRLHAGNIRVSDLGLLLVAMSLLLVFIFNVDVGTILDISHALLSLS